MHFHLEDIEALVHLGITDAEQAVAQPLLFGVSFDFDPAEAIKTDDITQTVDYQVIYDTVKEVAINGKWNLLETLHAELLKALENKLPKAQNLKLSITKFPWPEARVTVC